MCERWGVYPPQHVRRMPVNINQHFTACKSHMLPLQQPAQCTNGWLHKKFYAKFLDMRGGWRRSFLSLNLFGNTNLPVIISYDFPLCKRTLRTISHFLSFFHSCPQVMNKNTSFPQVAKYHLTGTVGSLHCTATLAQEKTKGKSAIGQ